MPREGRCPLSPTEKRAAPRRNHPFFLYSKERKANTFVYNTIVSEHGLKCKIPGHSRRALSWVRDVWGATSVVTHTFPPMTAPSPMVIRPRRVAPA